jgi:hypothetical protein
MPQFLSKAQNTTANSPSVKKKPPKPNTAVMAVMKRRANNPIINLIKAITILLFFYVEYPYNLVEVFESAFLPLILLNI